jgi:hypothetical protein
VIPGALALGCAAAVGAYTIALGGRAQLVTEALVVVAIALLALGLVLRWPGTIPSAVVLMAGAYLLARAGHTTVDGWAAAVGTALLAAAELATWSMDDDRRVAEERAATVLRVAVVGGVLALAALLDMLVVGAAGISAPAGLLLAAVGVAAAVAAVGVVLRLLRA